MPETITPEQALAIIARYEHLRMFEGPGREFANAYHSSLPNHQAAYLDQYVTEKIRLFSLGTEAYFETITQTDNHHG